MKTTAPMRLKLTYLNYPPGGDKKLCDCCDEEKQCASITMVWGDVAVICKDCLEGIVKEFSSE